MGIAAALLAPMSMVTMAPMFLNVMGLFFISCLLTIGVAGALTACKNQANARFFVLGWTPLLCGAVLAVFAALGLVSVDTGYLAFKVGSAAEATILALALANRINLMRREREQADAERLAARAAQSALLEERVAARTHQLSETLDHLKRAQDKLLRQERLASLAGMVAGMAHEVGNPLNFAHGGADVLREQIEGLARTWHHLCANAPTTNGEGRLAGGAAADAHQMDGLIAGAGRAVGLVNAGLQRIAKIMTNLRGYMQLRVLENQPADLVAEIESTLTMVGDTLARQGVSVVTNLAPLPTFSCRPGELNQVFMNIVLNACAAMTAGGRLEITSRAEADESVEIRFADTGPGVPPALREAIFEPFFSERALDASGTGLGLYIAREIVTRHGGELLLLDSERGACFAVRLPSGEPAGR
jgi:signal transduction histidine kinase